MDTSIPRVLTIAGSDSGGGAGIEADLKVMTALGCYGMAAITSVTAQNTVAVTGIHDLPPEEVVRQMDAVLDDLGADAAKTGMLSNAGIVEAVAESLGRRPVEKLVIDPVMVAKSGDALLQEDARQALVEKLLPLAYLVTPNLQEAEVLSGVRIESPDGLGPAAEKILALGPRYVLMKGGHLGGIAAVDCLYGGEEIHRYSSPRIDTKNTHGTGCTLSSAVACFLARGYDMPEAVFRAKQYLNGAIRNALPLGSGHGPLNHMWNLSEENADDEAE